MKEIQNSLRERLEKLKESIRQFKPQNERAVKEEIKKLYIDIANSLKSLNLAQEDLRKIAQEFKRRKTTHTDVSKFYSFIKSQTSAELDLATLLDRAWNLIVVEEYNEAIKILKRVLDIDPKNIKGLGFIGLALMNKALYDDAMLYFQQVLLSEPDNPFALNNLGYICYKKGIWGEAIEHLSKAANQTKDRMAALYANFYLGLVYYDRSMIPDAVDFFEKALKLGPNLQEAYYYLGLSEMKRYEFKKAVEHFGRCVKIDSDSKYGSLCKEELERIALLTEPDKIFARREEDKSEDTPPE